MWANSMLTKLLSAGWLPLSWYLRVLYSLASLSCCHHLNNFISVCVLSLLSYMILAHVLSHSLATDFIIKLNQDHTTVLCQMRSEVTGWRLQLAITATSNVTEHLLIKNIQCHVKTKGQKQEWIMILVYCESKPFRVQSAVRDLEKRLQIEKWVSAFFSWMRGLSPPSQYAVTEFFRTCGSGGLNLKLFFNNRE